MCKEHVTLGPLESSKDEAEMPLTGVLSKSPVGLEEFYAEKKAVVELQGFLLSPCKGMTHGFCLGEPMGTDLSLKGVHVTL